MTTSTQYPSACSNPNKAWGACANTDVVDNSNILSKPGPDNPRIVSQDCLRTVSGLSQDNLRTASGQLQDNLNPSACSNPNRALGLALTLMLQITLMF